ncbi:hypothetical protein NUU61_006363 [Penicillium alfredii]|uniref:Phenol 2-monooxygenase n=1 Tax=Penicillium alfredii TaxID=1506179 RepID=A0A9W9F0P8_9EURO|nr:uncharacterized protein NUU61_006363 [Penicillium alfredii]KAJ5091493.1 hypothetical protein NUU61_006363 [Penicillium alfredii]
MNEENNTSESHTDVLIVGAGPSGLMTAYWMARCGVRARIIDKRGTKVMNGHADGLRMRTLELFDSMGIQHRVSHEGFVTAYAAFWAPGEDGIPIRQNTYTSAKINESPLNNMLLSQGRIEQFILDSIQEHSDIQVERGVIAESLEYDEQQDGNLEAYPITVKLRTLSDEEASLATDPENKSKSQVARNGLYRSNLTADDWDDLIHRSKARQAKTEIVKAKYLIGCDGAHSWTRKQLNIPLEGSSTDHIWGVIDIIPITNFPDIRRLGTVTNASGTILVIPRERNLVRLYVPVQVVEAGTTRRFDRSTITPEMIRTRVREILTPYTFDFQICDWWTAYQVGQRIAPTFTKGNRIFLAGDAVHTHSPKVGLGMNMSMQDSFNVGWKVALVAAGVAHPSILSTYHPERHRLAEMLLDYDRHWSPLFTEMKSEAAESPDKTQTMIKVTELFEDFADGLKAFYGASSLVWKPEGGEEVPAVARCLIPGERFPPAKLRNQAEGGTHWTMRLMKSDGRFRVVILAGDMRKYEQKQRVHTLGHLLAGHGAVNGSLMRRYAPIPGRFDSPLDLMTIHSAPWAQAEFFDFPDILRPLDPVMGWAYGKIWCDDAPGWDRYCDGRAYETWGVDRTRGALVVIRPDQYIGWVGELENVDQMVRYLDGVLVRAGNARPKL